MQKKLRILKKEFRRNCMKKIKKIYRRIIAWVLTALTLGAIFVIFYFILVEKSKVLEKAVEHMHES